MMTYARYLIDVSVDLGSDRLHSCDVEDEWFDTEDDARAAAAELAKDELILTICEYHIEAAEEPGDEDWNRLRSRSPVREVGI